MFILHFHGNYCHNHGSYKWKMYAILQHFSNPSFASRIREQYANSHNNSEMFCVIRQVFLYTTLLQGIKSSIHFCPTIKLKYWTNKRKIHRIKSCMFCSNFFYMHLSVFKRKTNVKDLYSPSNFTMIKSFVADLQCALRANIRHFVLWKKCNTKMVRFISLKKF